MNFPRGKVFRLPLLARAIWRGARTVRLVLTADGIAARDRDGDVHRIPFREVVGMEKDGEARVVFGADGSVIPVVPDQFGAGAITVIDALDETIPDQLVFVSGRCCILSKTTADALTATPCSTRLLKRLLTLSACCREG